MPENICDNCVTNVFLVFDFSQVCISSDTKLRLQRNRTVLHNIQREIVEEENGTVDCTPTISCDVINEEG